jgi:hypothetical protein
MVLMKLNALPSRIQVTHFSKLYQDNMEERQILLFQVRNGADEAL